MLYSANLVRSSLVGQCSQLFLQPRTVTVMFSSVAQSILLTWICMMANFEAETFSHLWLNFEVRSEIYFFRKLANPENPFMMWILVVLQNLIL